MSRGDLGTMVVILKKQSVKRKIESFLPDYIQAEEQIIASGPEQECKIVTQMFGVQELPPDP
jgi:hypothetical protein